MSMIEKQISDLEDLKNRLKFQNTKIGDWELVYNAINTIQSLSAKLSESNLNNGWIRCSDRLPKEKDGIVLMCDSKGRVMSGSYSEFSKTWYKGDMCGVVANPVIAWQPLPKPYEGQVE